MLNTLYNLALLVVLSSYIFAYYFNVCPSLQTSIYCPEVQTVIIARTPLFFQFPPM